MLKKMRNNEKGFTLVELIVVIAILGILATLLVPRIMGNVKDAERQREISNARTIASEVTVHNAMAGEDGTTIPANLIAGYTLQSGDLTADLALPNGITFPTGTHASIIVDEKGNASVSIVDEE